MTSDPSPTKSETYKPLITIFEGRVTKEVFAEKKDVKKTPDEVFLPQSLELLSKDFFQSKIMPDFVKLYRKNSLNVPVILSYMKCFSIGYLNLLPQEVQLEFPQPKIFECLAHKKENLVVAGFETIQMILKLKNVEVRQKALDLMIKKIATIRNSEKVRHLFSTIFLSLKMKDLSDPLVEKLVGFFCTGLAEIKTKEIFQEVITQTEKLGKKFGRFFSENLELAAPLLQLGKVDEVDFIKFYLLSEIVLARDLTQEASLNFAGKVVKELYSQQIDPVFIKARAKLPSSYHKTVGALYSVTRILGAVGSEQLVAEREHYAEVIPSFQDKALYFYKTTFRTNVHTFVQNLLIMSVLMAEDIFKVSDIATLDLFFCDFVLSWDLDIQRFNSIGLGLYSAIRIGKVMNALRYSLEDKKTYFDAILNKNMVHRLLPIVKLEGFEAFGLVTLISINRDLDCVNTFINMIIKQDLQANLESLLTFPGDMENPICHHFFGRTGIFSKHMDNLQFYSNYCQILLVIKRSILFEDYITFYDADQVSSKEGLYIRCQQIETRNLEDAREYLAPYNELLEAQGRYVKPELDASSSKDAQKGQNKQKGKKKGGQAPPVDEAGIPKKRTIDESNIGIGEFELDLVDENSILRDYSYYLKRLTEPVACYFNNGLAMESPIQMELMDQIFESGLFTKTKKILQLNDSLAESVRMLVVAFLNNLITHAFDSDFGTLFSEMYFQILKNERVTTATVEEALSRIHAKVSDSEMHPGVCPILVDFCIYSFNTLFDGEGRRKSFDVISILSTRGSQDTALLIFKFISGNLNNLRYTEIRALLTKLIDFLKDTSDDFLNQLLFNLLNYQEFAVENLLTCLIEMPEEIRSSQKMAQFSRIKLSILVEGEDKKNAGIAQKLIDILGGPLDYDQIMDLDFSKFVTEVPFDLHEMAAQILNGFLGGLDANQKADFFDKVLEELRKQVDGAVDKIQEDPISVDVVQVEENLAVYPIILRNIIPNCPKDKLPDIFDGFMNVECYELPKISDACCEVGVAYLNAFSSEVQTLIEVFEYNLEKRENMIQPIVFLAASSKFLDARANKAKFKNLSEKILTLAEQDDDLFQVKLGQNMPKLLIFFGDIDTLIQEQLDQVMEEQKPSSIRGRCYLIVGILRGCGIKKVKEYNILDNIAKIVS